MINKSMWLGTSERMLWVPCPAIDMPRPQERWQASGTFANGGGWVRRSAAGHRVYDLSWNLMSASEISKIRAIFDGVYGQGPFYFIDPSAERTNVFPAAWAQPRLALDGGPPLVYDQVPSREVYPGPNSTYPQVGARYVLDSDSIPNVLRVPVPERHKFVFRVGYQNTGGDAEMSYRHNNGSWTPIGSAQHYTQGPGWTEFSIQGTGAINVFWMQGVVLSVYEPTPTFRDFYPGQGNSGVEIEDFMEHTHSVGIDKYGATVRLREVGSWL